jgi:hypothetical protein
MVLHTFRVLSFQGLSRLVEKAAPDQFRQAGVPIVRGVEVLLLDQGVQLAQGVLTLPIFQNQQVGGRIEPDESLRTIDAAIGRQVRTIFVSFTALVLLSGLLISLTVRDASRTMQRQYNEIAQGQQQLPAGGQASVGRGAGGWSGA